MGNNSSTRSEKSAELNDVHRKCVKTFTGTPLEDPDKFLQQLEAVKLVYSLSDQNLMKLALEKIEGRALEWLHSKPGLMTYGVDNFKRALLKEFSVSNEKNEPKNVTQQFVAPSAPPKIDLFHEEMPSFDQMPAPPSYESLLTTYGMSVQPPSVPPQVPLYPNISEMRNFDVIKPLNPENIEQKIEKIKEPEPKMKEKRNRNRKRVKENSQPKINIEKKPEDVLKETGTKPKIDLLCDFCQKAGHKSDACLLKATQSQNSEEKSKKCHYCKADGHLIQHCRKVPRCKKCNDNRHKTENCPESSKSDVTSSVIPALVDLKLESVAVSEKNSDKKCSYCKEEGHFNKDCAKAPRCHQCGDKFHKLKDCPFMKTDEKDSKVDEKDKKSDEKDKKCAYCKATDHFYRDCEKLPRCHNCGEKFHKMKDCPLLQKDSQSEPDPAKSVLGMLMDQAYNYFLATEQEPDKICTYCKEGGHLIRDCKVRPPCRTCGEKGHKTQNCPQNPVQSLPFANPRDGFCHNCKQMGHHTVDCVFKKPVGVRVFTNSSKK
ncbi:uncharacterized protein LOC134838007 [Culicoides brevitarsis]|uniref:uncharacterized protein LOC134838007 n=1 Tax=Culicoides brevitarsis TaxID=469753 RepID=UPI00307BFAEE